MDKYLWLLLLTTSSMLLIAGCQKQTSMAEEMTEPLQETLDRQQSIKHLMQGEQQYEVTVPGLSAAVILPDGTTWLGVSGKSSDSEDMNSDLLFGLSSVTKTYIAALVAELVEEGALSADDPVGKWIPELGELYEDITIRQLLNHTSGLYRYQQKPEYLAEISARPDKMWTAQEILEEFQGEPECQPDSCFGESLMEYVLLGVIVEKITGSSVSELLTERIFTPLELEHTNLYPEQQYPTEMMAHMWWDVDGSGEPVDVVSGSQEPPLAALFSSMWAGGAMHATAEDLARFAKELFEGRVIKEGALEAMVTPGPELHADAHYGYSVIIEQIDGQTAYWHPGGAGYSSIYYYFPDNGLTIAVLGNVMVDLQPTALALYETYLEHQS